MSKHISDQHLGRQTVYACPYCTQPFNQYRLYLEHMKENHDDKIIKCRICGEVFKHFFQLKNHAKNHVNQCPFCSDNFSTMAELQEHTERKHAEDPNSVERQYYLCAATFSTMEDLVSHMQEVHCPYACNICFMHFSAKFKLFDHRQKIHQIGNLGLPLRASDLSDQPPRLPAGPDAEADRPAQTKGDQGDQLPRSGEQAEPQQAEPQ